jgi:hypothetical protein
MLAVPRGDLVRQELQSRQFLFQVGMMGPLDVIDQVRQRRRRPVPRRVPRRRLVLLQLRQHGGVIEVLLLARLPQRALAAAAVIDAQPLEHPRP